MEDSTNKTLVAVGVVAVGAGAIGAMMYLLGGRKLPALHVGAVQTSEPQYVVEMREGRSPGWRRVPEAPVCDSKWDAERWLEDYFDAGDEDASKSFRVKAIVDYPATDDSYVAAVLARLPKLSDSQDAEIVANGVKHFQREGFSVGDAAAYIRCMEEVNPDLDEEVALARMAQIRAKYR